MNKANLAALEALLFASGGPLSIDALADMLELSPEACERELDQLGQSYRADAARGICLRKLDDRYVLTTKKTLKNVLTRLFKGGREPALTAASYETLAAIYYNQPVTRAQVEMIRGVNSDGIISRLQDRGWIEECGVLEQPGRPALFQVTTQCKLDLGLDAEAVPGTELLMYDNIRQLEEGEA